MSVCMEALIRVDPQHQWISLGPTDKNGVEDSDDSDDDSRNSRDPTIADKFPLLLADSSHEIRMYMTKSVKW